MSRMFDLYRKRWSSLSGALALALLTVAAGVGLLGVSGWLLTGAALAGAGATFNLFAPAALVRGLSFTRIGSRYAERLVGHGATMRLIADLRGAVFGALARLTPRQLARLRHGDAMARLTGDVDALDNVFLQVLMPLVVAVLAGAALAIVFWWLALPWAAWALAGALLFTALLLPWLLARWSRRPGDAAQQAAAALRGAVIDAVEGHADIVALDAGDSVRTRLEAVSRRAGAARRAQAAIAAHGLWALQAVAGAVVLALLWTGLPAAAAQRLSPPLLVGLLFAALGLFEVLGPLMRGAARMGATRAAGRRVFDTLHEQPDLADPAAPRSLPAHGVLQARDLHFSYAEQAVLRGVNLTLAPGERIAVAGASGAGKSTLLHLLLRLHDPDAGCVLYGGVDARDCTQADLHQRIALLSQDAPVFLGTVRENLLIAQAQADDEDLWRVLSAARLETFVRGLPGGLDAWVGETGATLSAGQARRLCLARVLLSPAQVLLLDEPTAGLDAATETEFLLDMAQAVRGRAVVLATHAALPPGVVQSVLRL